MRKIYFAFGAVASMALASGMVACSGDDDDNTVTPGVDSGPGTDATTPIDATPGKDATTPVEAGPCTHCKELLAGEGTLSSACTDSVALALAAVACGCNKTATGSAGEGKCDVDSGTTAADGGPGACQAFCGSPTTTLPDNTCITCGATQCASQFNACLADTANPTDGGTADAGDGG